MTSLGNLQLIGSKKLYAIKDSGKHQFKLIELKQRQLVLRYLLFSYFDE